MKTEAKEIALFVLYALLMIGAGGCANQAYKLDANVVKKSSEKSVGWGRDVPPALHVQAIKTVDEFNNVISCLLDKEKVVGITSWGKIAYMSAAFSGVATMGASAVVAGSFGAFSGVAKYLGDNDSYSKARTTIETQFNLGMDKYYKAIDSEDYLTASEQLNFNSLIVHKNRLDCTL